MLTAGYEFFNKHIPLSKSCIIFIMGVSGSGKTTIGKLLSKKTGIPFFDGDDFHSLANKDKMQAGLALTDDDRGDWLLKLQQLAKSQSAVEGAIIACSALKEMYRTILSKDISKPIWVLLEGTYEMLNQRMRSRTGHYMPVELLKSQLDTLEKPNNALTISIIKKPEEIVESIMFLISQK